MEAKAESINDIIRMKELVDGEYECYDWTECETQYGKTYIVKVRKTGESKKVKMWANSYLKKMIDNIGEGICQFIVKIKNGYVSDDNKTKKLSELPNGTYLSKGWKKITIKTDTEIRYTHVITLENGIKIWANAYLNSILNKIKYSQIQIAISNGKVIGVQTIKSNSE